MEPPARPHRHWPLVCAVGYALAIFVSGLYLHPVVMPSNEADNYAGIGRGLLRGIFYHDVFHPLLYPALTGLAGTAIGDYFIGGKLVSAGAAGWLVWLVQRIGARCISPACGYAAMLVIAVHSYIVENAFLATDNMLSTALCAAVLLVGLEEYRDHSRRRLLLLGFLFAMAYWCRYSAAALAVPVGLVLLLPGRATHGRRLVRLATVAAALLVSLVPHFVLSYLQFGRILYDENWRNLAMRHFSTVDFNFLNRMPFGSWRDVVLHDPATLIANGAANVAQMFGRELPGHITGWGSWGLGWVDWLFYGSAAGALGATLARRQPLLAITYSFSIAYLAALVITFYDWPRQVMLALPPLIVGACAIVTLPRVLLARWVRLARSGQVLLAGAMAGYVGWHAPEPLKWMADHQLTAERDAIDQIVGRHGSEVQIYVPYLAWALTLHSDFRPQQGFFPSRPFDLHAYLAALQLSAARDTARFFVFSPLVMDRPDFELLAAGPIPAPLRVVTRTADLLVLEAAAAEPADRPHVRVEPNPFRGGALLISAYVRKPAPGLRGLALEVSEPNGTRHWFPVPGGDDGVALTTHDARTLARGSWQIVPYALVGDERIAGPRYELVVE